MYYTECKSKNRNRKGLGMRLAMTVYNHKKTLKAFVTLISLHVCKELASTTRLTSYGILSVVNHKSGVKELITCNCAKIRAEKFLMTGITPYK